MGLKGTGPVLLILAFMVGVYLFWGDGQATSETFRYKLTINVRVDGTPYSASSVIEARQEVNSCRSWVGSRSRKCLPLFSAKGVAPMITLPDGAVIFASLSGNSSDKPPGVKGTGVARLPWLVYVPDWRAVADTSGKNWSIIPLPEETPRTEIPFADHTLSKYRPSIRVSVPGKVQLPKALPVSNDTISKVMSRDVNLISFRLEPTNDRLVEKLEDAPPAMIEARRNNTLLANRQTIESYSPAR